MVKIQIFVNLEVQIFISRIWAHSKHFSSFKHKTLDHKIFEKIYVPSFKGEFPAEKFIKLCQCSQNGIPKLCEYGSENHMDVAGK